MPATAASERITLGVIEAGETGGEDDGGVADNMTSACTERKSSGEDWLGKIIRHGNVSALKRVLSKPLKYGVTEAGDCDDRSFPRYLPITDFANDGRLRADTFASLPEEIARDSYVNEGDVLFARSVATVGKTFLCRDFQDRACFAGYLIKVSSARHKLMPEFLYYFTKSPAYEAWKDLIFTQAAIQNIGADRYAYLPVCFPPFPEQQRIAAYLDASCAAIDAAVAAKRRQLGTLDALASSIINRAITRGCEEHVSVNSTGVDWFPEWRIVRFKSLLRLIYRYPAYFNIEYVPEGIAEVPGEALTPDGFIETLPDERRVTGEFLRWLLRSTYFNEALNSSAPQTTIKTITMPQLAKLRVALPPKSEQHKICNFLKTKVAEVKRIVSGSESQIATLTAYGKSLIHECVTGQRRVTEADVLRSQLSKNTGQLKLETSGKNLQSGRKLS